MLNNISEYLTQWAALVPERVYCQDLQGIKLTYMQFESRVNQCCYLLSSLGVHKGNVLSINTPNTLSFMVIYLACIRSGIIINPCQSSLSRYEIIKNLLFVQSDLFITHKDFEYSAEGINTKIFIFKGDKDFFTVLDAFSEEPFDIKISKKDIACYYNSSGTTGDSKYIIYNHFNMVSMIKSVVSTFRFDDHSRHLGFLPFAFTSITNYSFLPMLFSGGLLILAGNFISIRTRFWDIVNEYKINYTQIVPTIAFTMLSSEYSYESIKANSTLKFIGCGSAPLSTETQKSFQDNFGIPLVNLYGLSESGPAHFDDPLTEDWEPGGIGLPLPVFDCRIFNDDLIELPDGEVGEIALKGDNLFVGYLNNPEAEERSFRKGYFLTGDLGYKDKNGKFFFKDRKKDLIIRGGINIAPGEIEEIIFSVAGIISSAVVGIHNPMLGEDIIAFVECDSRFKGKDFLMKVLKSKLQPVKIPTRIEVIDKMPKGPTGKILKKALKELLSEVR